MGVDATHPEFDAMLPKWIKVRDCIEGDEAVKAKGTEYLAALTSQDMMTMQGETDYAAYRDRALFYDAPDRTAKALAGAILRKIPDVNWPEGKKDLLKDITREGDSLNELVGTVVEESVGLSRIALLVDAVDGGLPFITTYYASQITNWEEDTINGRKVPVRIHLKEESLVADPDNEFGWKTSTQYRVLLLGFVVGDGEEIGNEPVYIQEVWTRPNDKGEFVKTETIIPTMIGGRTLSEIPIEIINPSRTGLSPEKPPILGLCNIALSHYRNSADLEHGRHWTALPTAWAAGFPTKDDDGKTVTFLVGAEAAWITEEPQARAGYLEFSGKGLGHIAEGMASKERLMAVLGARMLEEQKTGVEAAEAIKLRQGGEQSVLARISGVVSEAFTKTLQRLHLWLSPSETEVGLVLNSDFNFSGITPQELTALVQAMQSGSMSWNTFFWNLQRGEMVPEGRDEEEEAMLLAEGIPGLGLVTPPVIEEEEPEPEEDEEGDDESEEDDDA